MDAEPWTNSFILFQTGPENQLTNQRSRWQNGTEVTVNFGDLSYSVDRGKFPKRRR